MKIWTRTNHLCTKGWCDQIKHTWDMLLPFGTYLDVVGVRDGRELAMTLYKQVYIAADRARAPGPLPEAGEAQGGEPETSAPPSTSLFSMALDGDSDKAHQLFEETHKHIERYIETCDTASVSSGESNPRDMLDLIVLPPAPVKSTGTFIINIGRGSLYLVALSTGPVVPVVQLTSGMSFNTLLSNLIGVYTLPTTLPALDPMTTHQTLTDAR